MKILFQSRLDIFERRGGDTVQMEETKKALEDLGVKVDIDNSLNKDLSGYDLVHIFNLDWVCETYPQIKNAKKQKKPVILSPIHHSLDEFKRYEQKSRYGLAKLGNTLIPSQPLRDTARNIVKGLIYPSKLKPALFQLFMGIRRQQKLSLEMSDYVIVQTKVEAELLKKDYKTNSFKWEKVVNGVNVDKFDDKNIEKARDLIPAKRFIYCVGRIEPRKNQLNLIKAFKMLQKEDEKFKNTCLVFSGAINSHHPTYKSMFEGKIKNNKNMMHTGFVEQEVLAGLYASCTVFCVPSWFETTGLVYLEAALSGAESIVASTEQAKEYLKTNALYCDPANLDSIKNALKSAVNQKTVDPGFKEEIKQKYTWQNTAEQTLKIYRQVLSNNRA